jgi:hypothetical protein
MMRAFQWKEPEPDSVTKAAGMEGLTCGRVAIGAGLRGSVFDLAGEENFN